MDRNHSLALLEVANLTLALIVADRCLKAAGVTLLGIESTDSADQCIKLVGETGAVMAAGQVGVELARHMGSRRRCRCCRRRSRRRGFWPIHSPFTAPCSTFMITAFRKSPSI